MPVTEAELVLARSFIGNIETDDDFNERFDRLSPDYDERTDALEAAIEESMRAQLSAMLFDGPAQASAPGGVSYSQGANIQTLAQQLADLRKNSVRGVHVGRLVRPRRR